MSLDDLSTTPATDTPRLSKETQEYLVYLGDLIDDTEVYGFAVSTLQGIRDSIRADGRITEGRRGAVRNIVAGAEEGAQTRERNKRSRRYEGWSR